jgi:hypothetical protein
MVPVRAAAFDSSEMISQLLFGELVETVETKGRMWSRVRCHWDNLVGWVQTNQLQALTPSEFAEFNEHFAYNLEFTQAIMGADFFLPITIGAQLPNFDGIRFQLADARYTFSGQAVFPRDIMPAADFILKIARRYLHSPTLNGGRSPFGIDSSGLTQMVFKIAGIPLPRAAAQQVFCGEAVDFMEQAQPGDLAFFEDRAGRIAHVGILLPGLQIIHSYGKVRIDSIDHFGIYHNAEARYTHKLRVVKRVLPKLSPQLKDAFQPAEAVRSQIELF